LLRWRWLGIATDELPTANPESETNFSLKALPAIQVTFRKDASGKVSGLVSRLNGVGHEAKRLDH
jgi:hypothetical protein